ncbi:C4-type zinc ribbon domain-containing protein [Desulfococcaceae bacterium HSG9]|nr:C4-type zinc ribbon domain-containing protein [Desulfococcaceae bacterium HSG9]
MSTTLEEQIFTLLKLQKNETEMTKMQNLLDSTPRKIKILDARLAEYEQKIYDRTLNQDQLKKNYRDNETDVQLNYVRIERSQEKLNSVKTNKEYQALLKEIEEVKAINSRIEDEMLDILGLIEENEKQIAATQDEYTRETDKINREKELIQSKAEEIKNELAQFESEWEQISHKIEPKLLEEFNKVKTWIPDSKMIVPVTDAVCGGCNMSIMPQTYNELQRSEKLMYCPHCQRMIYHENIC